MEGRDDVWELDLEEATETTDGLDPTVLKLVSEQIEQLPPFPLVVNHVLRVIEDPNSSLADLGKIILNDPSLTAKILQIINSAYYGFAGQVSTVTHAVALLGSREIRNLALSLPINNTFFQKGRSFGLNQCDLWVHSLSVGVCGRRIAETVRYRVPEEAFVAGLLHDIGKNVLNDVFPERFDQVLRKAEAGDVPLVDVEKELLSISHDSIGFWVAQHWKLPTSLTSAIQEHHQPLSTPALDDAPGVRLEAIIFLADLLAKLLSLGFSGSRHIPAMRPQVLDHLSLTGQGVISIAEAVQQTIQPILRPFGVEIDIKQLSDEDKANMLEFLKGG